MTTREAIEAIAKELQEEFVVCTTGYTCRDMQAAADRPRNFYMIGSMGLAASLGLGIASSKPEEFVVVLDGDGALLMGLSILPMVGAIQPKNFIHVVLDNEVFASTGGQRTYSKQIPLEGMARACGYSSVERATSPSELTSLFRRMRAGRGPAFLLVKCAPDAGAPRPRVSLNPEAITARFQEEVARV